MARSSYGGEIIDGTVTSLQRTVGTELRVGLSDGTDKLARRVLVTTGLVDELPAIPGLAEVINDVSTVTLPGPGPAAGIEGGSIFLPFIRRLIGRGSEISALFPSELLTSLTTPAGQPGYAATKGVASRDLSPEEVEQWGNYVNRRMGELGIPEGLRGYSDPRSDRRVAAFDPIGEKLGSNLGGRGIAVDRGVFGQVRGWGEWNRALIETRIDAIIAHEEYELGYVSHRRAVDLYRFANQSHGTEFARVDATTHPRSLAVASWRDFGVNVIPPHGDGPNGWTAVSHGRRRQHRAARHRRRTTSIRADVRARPGQLGCGLGERPAKLAVGDWIERVYNPQVSIIELDFQCCPK